MKALERRTLLLTLLIVGGAAGCEGTDDRGQAAPDASTPVTSSHAAPVTAKAHDLVALVDLIVAEANELPREEFDPAALARKLGKEPRSHFEWVRENTWWAPYRGLLRGSKGVMLDRVGSNLDRAILLGDLLRRSGYTVRLAHAELPEADAKQLLGKLPPIPARRRAAYAAEPPSAEQVRIIEAILPKEEASFGEQVASAKRRSEEAKGLVRSQSERLLAAAKSVAVEDRETGRKAIAALRDHWWIERLDGGKWIPMDVLVPDGDMGGARKAPTATREWKADAESPAIPESDWHSVQVRVVIERYEEGSTSESIVLETVLRPAEVFDRPIVLAHLPRPWPDSPPDAQADPNALGNAAVAVKEWVPFLLVGDQPVAQSGFTEDGQLVSNPLSPARDVAETGGAGFMSGFGEALGGGESASSSNTAEWIDYEIRAPGEERQRVRRQVFDLLGPVNRAAKTQDFDATTNERLIERYEALLSTTDIMLQPCNIPEDYLAFLATRTILANESTFRELARQKDSQKAADLATDLLDRIERWGPLPSLAFWRAEVGGAQGAWFIDRPNVLNFRISPPVVDAGEVHARGLMDIAANSIGTGLGESSFDVRVRQGVADTVAEMLAMGSILGETANTASLFSSADEGFGKSRRIVPGDVEAIQSLGWPEDTAAQLVQDVDAGFIAVTLQEPVSVDGRDRVGWWRISPMTGETIGVMDSGFHADETEYSQLVQLMNALNNFLRTHAARIEAARRLPSLTPGQSLLLRAAVAAERALEAFASSRQPFP